MFGRKPREKTVDRDGRVRVRDVEVPFEQWSVCLPEHHPGYVTWTEYLATRQRLPGQPATPGLAEASPLAECPV